MWEHFVSLERCQVAPLSSLIQKPVGFVPSPWSV